MNVIYSIDFAINNFIESHLRVGLLNPIMEFISFLGDSGWFWIALALALLIFRKTRKIGLTIGIALLFSLIFTNLIIKPLVDRPRPWVYAYEHFGREITLLIRKPSDASFPSGHTSVSFAGATALFMYTKKWGIPALVLASLIAYSRLYFFVHYPTDVLFGLLLGVLYGVCAYFIVITVSKKIKARNSL